MRLPIAIRSTWRLDILSLLGSSIHPGTSQVSSAYLTDSQLQKKKQRDYDRRAIAQPTFCLEKVL